MYSACSPREPKVVPAERNVPCSGIFIRSSLPSLSSLSDQHDQHQSRPRRGVIIPPLRLAQMAKGRPSGLMTGFWLRRIDGSYL